MLRLRESPFRRGTACVPGRSVLRLYDRLDPVNKQQLSVTDPKWDHMETAGLRPEGPSRSSGCLSLFQVFVCFSTASPVIVALGLRNSPTRREAPCAGPRPCSYQCGGPFSA
jgi:hypothetical protein